MGYTTLCIFLGVTTLALSFFTISLFLSILALNIVFILWLFFSTVSTWVALLLFLLFQGLTLPLTVPQLRRRLVSNRLLKLAKTIMPKVSTTEQQALDAGTLWWDAELWSGSPAWKKILNYNTVALTAEEKAFLDGPVEELCTMLNDWEISHDLLDLPPEVWQFLKEQGFFGIIIPKTYGGLEFSATAHSAIVTKVASRSITAAVTIMVPNSLGPAELLRHYGTADQKEYYLPRLASGEEIPCFGLTGPEAGSDASSIPDHGIVCNGKYEGEETIGIRLNWHKRYITLGPIATLIGLAFKLYDPDHLLGDESDLGITFAIIPSTLPGIESSSRHFPLNCPFQNGPNSGKDVFITMDMIIGGEAGAGRGWSMLMEALAAGRGISLPALSTGGAKLIARTAGAYAAIRKQFNLPIGKFEGVEEALTRIAGLTYIMDSARTLTVSAIDNGERPAVVTGIVKYHLTEMMRQAINDGMDIQGGAGICLGPSNILGRVYQAAPIGITVEGANILTRSFIIFNQSLLRCHPFIYKEIEAIQTENQDQFDRAFFSHLGFLFSNLSRTFIFGLTGTWWFQVPGNKTVKKYLQNLSRMSSCFALVADLTTMLLGPTLKRKEKLTGRLSDGLGNLFLATTVIKHYHDQGTHPDDLPLVEWACQTCLFNIQESLLHVLDNLPSSPLALFLRIIIFPFGRPFKQPNDQLGKAVAKIILQHSPARERLTTGIFIPTNPAEPLARLESCLRQTHDTEKLAQRLRTAVKDGRIKRRQLKEQLAEALQNEIINMDEADAIRAMQELHDKVIAVDDFSTLSQKEHP